MSATDRINKLKFAEQFRPAFKQVFGRTIICQTLEIAGAYTRSHGLNAITLDGDKYDRKGSLTGGFHDVRRSRLDAVKAIKAAQHRDGELRAHHTEVRNKLTTLDQEITHVLGQIQVAEQRLQRVVQEREPLIDEAMRAQDEADRARTRLARLEKQLAEHKSNMRALERECELWREEMESEFEDALSSDEEATMKRLSEEVEAKRKELVELSKRVSEVRSLSSLTALVRLVPDPATPTQLATKKNVLEIELNEDLRRRREELRARLDSLDTAGAGADDGDDDDGTTANVEAKKKQLAKLRKQVEALNTRVEGASLRAHASRGAPDPTFPCPGPAGRDRRPDRQAQQGGCRRREGAREAAEPAGRRPARHCSPAKERRAVPREAPGPDTTQGRVQQEHPRPRRLAGRGVQREHGVVRKGAPGASFFTVSPRLTFLARAPILQLLKKLRKVNESLKGFAHVNKKAYEQYTSFTKQRDELLARQDELDKSQESIEELIGVLDARKDEAIERTFKQVAKNFADVFEKLVPTGRGRLIMLQRQLEKVRAACPTFPARFVGC